MSDLHIDLSDFGVAPSGRTRTDPVAGAGPGGSPQGSVGLRLRWFILLVVPGTLLPFLLLLRGSVHAHAAWGLAPWPSVFTGMALSALTLGLFLWAALAILGFPRGFRRILSRGAIALAVVFVFHGLLHVGVRNVKGDEVRAEYRSLHPLLRLGSTMLVVADRDAVMTDAARGREDYAAMGLPPAETSLHYPQEDGYVHALDLRTRGRPEWRNVLVDLGYRLMGFRTLRHHGTADHLHVSLPPRSPGRG